MNNRLAKTLYRTYGAARREPVMSCLKELKRTESYSRQQLGDLQWKRLKSLVEHAYKHVPFYRKRFDEAGLTPQAFSQPSDLERIPPLTTEELATCFDELKASQSSPRFDKVGTSGSTGHPRVVLRGRLSTAYSRAAMYRGHAWFGVDVGEREARLWGRPLRAETMRNELIRDRLMNRRRLSAYSLDDTQMEHFLTIIKGFEPTYLMGYPTLLYEFSLFLRRREIDGSQFGLKMVKVTSETLFDHHRETMHETFHCPVVNEYGCTEAGIMGFECPHGGLHVPMECVFVEIQNREDVEGLDGGGSVLVTDLFSYTMPIIRYDVGDIAMWGEKACDCGRHTPILDSVKGRTSDFIETPDGTRINTIFLGYMFTGLRKRGCEVRCFQAVRKSARDIVLQVVRGERFDEPEFLQAFESLSRVFGSSVDVRYSYVTDIRRSGSGKFRYFVSEWESDPHRQKP